MGETSAIQWTDATFNAWEGCVRVSEACRYCYAETRDQRVHGGTHWGPNSTRKMMSESYWQQPLRWNKQVICDHCGYLEVAGSDDCRKCGRSALRNQRVFCSSLADVFEDRPELITPRRQLFELIDRTPYLTWLLLTKRPESVRRLWPFGWYDNQFSWPNIWVGATVENQLMANKRIPELLQIPSRIRFLSCEPLLGPIELNSLTNPSGLGDHCFDALSCDVDAEDDEDFQGRTINLVIAGGESGPNARPLNLDAVRSLRDQCKAADVAFFMKQMGSVWAKENGAKDKKGGDINEFPEDLRVREMPRVETK